MTDPAAQFGAGAILLIGLFLVVLAVLWFLLPFAVFGLKGIVRQAVSQQQRTNELLQALLDLKKEERAVRIQSGGKPPSA